MAELITIPREEYLFLMRCRHVVESEFEEKFSKKFIQEIKESQDAYRRGDFVKFKNVKEAKAFFDKL